MTSSNAKYGTSKFYSGSSTAELEGIYIVDSEAEIDSSMAPQVSFMSLENADEKFGLGFESGNKHMLLFAAGNSVGMSHVPYATEAGIIYGDPMIRIDAEALKSELSGYTKDVGKMVFNGDQNIQDLIEFDYNGDGYKDILLFYKDGLVRLLENEISNQKFRDRGYVLNIYGGIYAATRIDINNDGYDDIIVGTEESCTPGEVCVTQFINDKGHFIRSSLNLKIEGKAYELKSGDMNNDGCEDLVVSDSAGNIRSFYNQITGSKCSGIDEMYGGPTFNFGITIDEKKDGNNSLFIYYDGIAPPFDGSPDENYNDSTSNEYVSFLLPTSEASGQAEISQKAGGAGAFQDEYIELQGDILALQSALENAPDLAGSDIPPRTYDKNFDFHHVMKEFYFMNNSHKQTQDVNGESLNAGDYVDMLVSVGNGSGQAVNNFMVSDLMPATMTLIPETLQCLDPNCGKIEWVDTGNMLRPKVVKIQSIAAGQTKTFKYTMKVNEVPKVNFDVGNDFADYKKDDYLDIFVRPTVNPEGIYTYLYSSGLNGKGHVVFSKKDVWPEDEKVEELPSDWDQQMVDLKRFADTPDSKKDFSDLNKLKSGLAEDTDYNGCPDSWNPFKAVDDIGGIVSDVSNAVANAVSGAITALRCSGKGCVPIPYNYAPLVPGDPAIPGWPLIHGVSTPIWVGVGPSTRADSVFRLYLSPTLTVGLGVAACIGPGPGHASPCIAVAVPLGKLGPCDFLEELAQKVAAKISNSINDTVAGASAMMSSGSSGGDASMPTDIVPAGEASDTSKDVNKNFGYDDADSPFSVKGAVNLKIPGFPAVITNWLDGQTDEIYNKLLDLPDFYLISPDFSKIGEIFTPTSGGSGGDQPKSVGKSFQQFMSKVNSMPLIQIESKEVLLKVPAITKQEIERWKRSFYFWKTYHIAEWERFKNSWTCVQDEVHKSVCDKIGLNVTEFIKSVEQIMEKLDALANLPRDILNFRAIESKYALQLICYMDAIMDFVGGYMKRQEKTIEAWMKLVEEIIKIYKGWRAILDLVLEYQTSCDVCKNDRFSMLGLLLQIFAVIPSPPIIPMPKLPDFVFDMSQIQFGIKIVWPDIKFKPQPIKLPPLPTFRFPDVLPEIEIKVPPIPIPDWFDIPVLMLPDLPDLPPLPLPELPEIPRPPSIPKIPNVVLNLVVSLKVIFKILCLIKNGFIPIPESTLKTQIETLTQPNLKVVLPIIAAFSIKPPGIQYDYVEQIKANLKISIGADITAIYGLTKSLADISNGFVEGFIGEINHYGGDLLSKPLQNAIDKIIDEIEKKAQEAIAAAIAEAAEAAAEAASAVADKATDMVDNLKDKDKQENTSDELSLYDYQDDFDEFVNGMNEATTEMENYVASLDTQEYPDKIYLKFGQSYMNPDDPMLNRTLAQVERDIELREADGTNEMARSIASLQNIEKMRDSLIAYTKDIDKSNSQLNQNIDDYGSFVKVLADTDPTLDLVASLSMSSVGNSYRKNIETTVVKNALGSSLYDQIDLNHPLLAAAGDSPQDVISSGSGNDAAVPKGFFIVIGNQNENVLNYTDELDDNSHMVFTDTDHDDDFDIIYTLGADVYLKENFKNTYNLPKGKVVVGYASSSVTNLAKVRGSVQGTNSPYEGNKEAEVTWNMPKDRNVYAYEVLLRESLLDDEDEFAQRYIVLANPINSDESKMIMDVLGVDAEDENVSAALQPEYPKLTTDLANGNYYASVYAVYEDGSKSVRPSTSIVAPSICADNEPPFPAAFADTVRTPIFKKVTVDASGSFDAGGEIAEYELNFLGAPVPVQKFADSPKFKVGEFDKAEDLGLHKGILTIKDESGNPAQQNVDIEVFAPEIQLDTSFERTSIASGKTDPEIDYFPFSLFRERFIYRVIDGGLKLIPRTEKITTPAADDNGKYLTDIEGNYTISDFDLIDMIWVENSDGEIIAEIHPDTGNIGDVDEGYYVEAKEAIVPTEPTRVEILANDGTLMGTVYAVADPNTDIKTYEELLFDTDNTELMYGVNVSDVNLSDQFEFIRFPSDDLSYPGGVALVNKEEKKPMTVIDTAGNILLLDSRTTIQKKQNDHYTQPLIIQILFEGKLVAEVYISPGRDGAYLVGPNDVPYATPRAPSASSLYGNFGDDGGKIFGDIHDYELEGIVEDLFEKGIVEGRQTEDGINLDPNGTVNRAEFVKTLLTMLCIIPREEAYLADSGFSDFNFADPLPWYYPYVKEGHLLGLVEGYQGEMDQSSGLTPFRPEKTITRAEGVKMILEALEMQKVIDLSSVKVGEPWYEPFMEIGQDLSPYMTTGNVTRNNFIITPEEAETPDKVMTREQLMIMANRVLEIYNCFEIDKDQDGMSDFCEAKYEIDDPEEDRDNDGLTNFVECYHGFDPTDQDTDGGGMFDGAEVEYGTNPLNLLDDPFDDDKDGLTNLAELLVHGTDPNNPDTDGGGENDGDEVAAFTNPLVEGDDGDENAGDLREGDSGLYIVPPECNQCPCQSTFLHKADIIPGDKFFTVVSTLDESHIFNKSNVVTIQSVNKEDE